MYNGLIKVTFHFILISVVSPKLKVASNPGNELNNRSDNRPE